ncbi:MAG: preprotein translocase subunit YajC [Gemmatimonas sp.]|nr:preprotein translocase subunit YajC [Gemmatimonas sp.]
MHIALVLQAPAQGGGMGMALIIQLVLIVAIFYFLLIMPQRREQKRHREMLAQLRPGDEIVTSGGVIGEVVQLKEDRVTLKSGDSRLLIEKARVARKL